MGFIPEGIQNPDISYFILYFDWFKETGYVSGDGKKRQDTNDHSHTFSILLLLRVGARLTPQKLEFYCSLKVVIYPRNQRRMSKGRKKRESLSNHDQSDYYHHRTLTNALCDGYAAASDC